MASRDILVVIQVSLVVKGFCGEKRSFKGGLQAQVNLGFWKEVLGMRNQTETETMSMKMRTEETRHSTRLSTRGAKRGAGAGVAGTRSNIKCHQLASAKLFFLPETFRT